MKVLIVEDDGISRELLRSALEEMGYDVLAARNGREALATLRDSRCRVVVSDWAMPEMNGLELCRAIRAGEFRGYVYIILLTAKGGTGHVVEGLTAGADDFMSKPFEPEELHLRIRAGERIVSLETRDLAIFALARLAESRDPETGGHLERVRRYSRVLGEALAASAKYAGHIDEAFIRLLYEASPLHDIGKVAIPDHVLLKPGRLDDHEFEIMKTHTAQGARTLESALKEYPEAEFLRMARDIAAYHHERWDGRGYPDRLAGEDIPLAARIFSVADVYDALVVRRVYKGAFTHDVARSIIAKGRASQFDPDVADAFLAHEAAFVEIKERFEDEGLHIAHRAG
ncbi:MAG TPA: HD domain-containing phosphohydrolase [Phycisphaerae bacterium]|nr:HD domain-containing phosphohydrolase [Phycisphaerae bacterium]